MVTRLAIACAALAVLLGGIAYAHADVVIVVNKTTQRLSVAVDGTPRYEWPVSTARMGYNTPNGTYRPERLERQWFSRKYDWSPMPHSIFFDGGYAIHGSYEISRLGTPASHGCIRLHPNNAATLYSLVQEHRNSTRIVITGERPSRLYMSSEHYPRNVMYDDRPPRSAHSSHARGRAYVEDEDDYRPPRSSHGNRYRSSRDFEEIFNQTQDNEIPTGAIPDPGIRNR